MIWLDKKKRSTQIGKMKTRVKECHCWKDSFVACDLNGDCMILHAVSYSKQLFSILPICRKMALSVCCGEDGVIVGTHQGNKWYDWFGHCLSEWNEEREIQWNVYSSPLLCSLSPPDVQVQVEKGFVLKQIAG